jgi:hypothetical protein
LVGAPALQDNVPRREHDILNIGPRSDAYPSAPRVKSLLDGRNIVRNPSLRNHTVAVSVLAVAQRRSAGVHGWVVVVAVPSRRGKVALLAGLNGDLAADAVSVVVNVVGHRVVSPLVYNSVAVLIDAVTAFLRLGMDEGIVVVAFFARSPAVTILVHPPWIRVAVAIDWIQAGLLSTRVNRRIAVVAIVSVVSQRSVVRTGARNPVASAESVFIEVQIPGAAAGGGPG